MESRIKFSAERFIDVFLRRILSDKLFKRFRDWLWNWRMKRAKKRCCKYCVKFGATYVVVNINGKPTVIRKQTLRYLRGSGQIKMKPEDMKRRILYEAVPSLKRMEYQ